MVVINTFRLKKNCHDDIERYSQRRLMICFTIDFSLIGYEKKLITNMFMSKIFLKRSNKSKQALADINENTYLTIFLGHRGRYQILIVLVCDIAAFDCTYNFKILVLQIQNL